MNKQKKNFKTIFENSVFSKGEFYVKLSLIMLVATIFVIIFIVQNGRMFFEFYPYTEKFKNYDFQLHVINVGNGDAMLIKFPNNQTMMIDTGDEYYSDVVESYVQQYLWSENLSQIDYLVLTHSDSDHVGGAKSIFQRFKVANLYRPKVYSLTESENLVSLEDYNISETTAYNEAIKQAYKENCNMIFNEVGISFNLGGAEIEFLAPLSSKYSLSNNYSAVIKITYLSKSFLFMGDAETSVEESLIKEYGESLKADVLKVGHHGSYTSTSKEFINIVRPEYAILSCNESKYYPHKDVVNNLKNVNATMISTGVKGSFSMSIENNKIVYAKAEKSSNDLALVFTIFMLLIFIIWENPFKKINPFINKIKND